MFYPQGNVIDLKLQEEILFRSNKQNGCPEVRETRP